jgi:hypothetical protein
MSLEKLGLVQEMDFGYGASFTSDGVNPVPPSGDPAEDEKLRIYMIRKAREETTARERRLKRLRKLARMDFKMVGGVAPVGFARSGGGETGSMAGRS